MVLLQVLGGRDGAKVSMAEPPFLCILQPAMELAYADQVSRQFSSQSVSI